MLWTPTQIMEAEHRNIETVVRALGGVVPAVLAAVMAWRFRNESASPTANK